MYIIVTDNKEIFNIAKEKGARITQISAETSKTLNIPKECSKEEAVTELLDKFITYSCNGYWYLKHILIKMLSDDSLRSIDFYFSLVANSYKVSCDEVKIDIFNAVKEGFNSNPDVKLYEEVFGNIMVLPLPEQFAQGCAKYLLSNYFFV